MTNRIGPMDQGSIGKVGNKVDDTGTSGKVSGAKGAVDKTAPNPVATNDTVNLTSNAKLLERLEKTLDSVPAIDAARVAEVKTAIENGDYEIDAEAIADAMIRLEQSLGD